MQSKKLNNLYKKLGKTKDFDNQVQLKHEITDVLEKSCLSDALTFVNGFIEELQEYDRVDDIDTCLVRKASILRKLGNPVEARSIYFGLLKGTENLSIKARTYMGFAVLYYSSGDRSRTLKYINKAIELAEKIDDRLTYAKALNVKGAACITANKNLMAYNVFSRARNEFFKLNEMYHVANEDVWLASALTEMGDYHRSIEHLTRALEYFEKHEVMSGIADTCNSLGLNCLRIEQYDQAKNFMLRALEYYVHHKAKDKMADIESNLGLLYKKFKHYPMALQHYFKSLEYRPENSFYKRMYTFSNICSLYVDIEDYENAEKYLQMSLDIHEDLKLKDPFISTYNMALKLATVTGDDRKFKYYEGKIAGYESTMTLVNKEVFFSICSKYYESVNDYNKTIYYLKKFIDLQYDIRNENRELYETLLENRLEIMKYTANLEKEEKENEKLRELNQDLQRVNTKLLAAQKEIIELERKNSVLAMGITINHEIRQPLMALYGYIEMLDMNIENKTDAQRRFFDKIYKNKEQIDVLLSKYRDNNNYTFDEYVDDITMVQFE